ncbi:hypothetical protein EJ110_NYTH29899 [Nymphaea thermarum]|nr:hypothetical protein EJ110_NYTH29899 [Nymphaea thermarum]
MESYLNENFGGVRSKNSSEEALRRWRRVCGIVKNRKRRFRFTANLSKRSEAEAMRRTNNIAVSLQYLTLTRPKISLAVNYASHIRNPYFQRKRLTAATIERRTDLGSTR